MNEQRATEELNIELEYERVRDILLNEFGYTHKEGTW